MTTGPGDEIAAARGRLRASHADREQVIGTLKAAFVQGMLDKDEFDLRVGQTLASRTCGELAALTADLPSGLVTVPRPDKAARARTHPPMSKVVAGAVLIIPAPAMVVATLCAPSGALAKVAGLVLLVSLMAWFVAAAQIIASSHDNRSRRQLPPRRAQRERAVEGEQDTGTGCDLMLTETHTHVRARHLPGHGTIQRAWRSLPVHRGQHWNLRSGLTTQAS